MLKIALTGGIGSGKTQVTEYFRSLDVPVLDADEISHELTSKNTPITKQIIATFGRTIVNEDGSLNRKTLHKLVFNDEKEKSQLEAILHPEIRRHMQERLNLIVSTYCVLAIPLLIETEQAQSIDRVLVVEAPTDIRRERVARRSALSKIEIEAVFAAQASDTDRRKIADDIIINDGSLSSLLKKVKKLHDFYKTLAQKGSS